jgi:uncharacterized membrane protein YphA (DoxX/SURF4 family)
LHTILWIIAGLLAAAFLASGVMKLVRPGAGAPVLADLGPGTVRTIGVLEILAAVGLVLPAALGIAPVLVPLAAVGLALLMVAAAITHLRRRETAGVVVTLALCALAVVVAWGRFGPTPFAG